MANAGRSEWWQQPSRNTESVRRGASEKTQWTAHSDSLGGSGERAEVVADTTGSHRHEHEIIKEHGATSSQEILGNGSGIPRECTWWVSEPNMGRVVNGVPDRIHRIKSLGNAVVPQLTYVIGMSIIKAMQDD